MNKHAYYVEFYGKKLKITLEAESIAKGKALIRDKIIFHKIEPLDYSNNALENLMNIFGIKL
jgi:hypothetical protein